MKTIKTFFLLTVIIAGFSSCLNVRSIQLQLNNLHTDIDYELISAIYEGEREKTVYLNPIDSSHMENYTIVKNSRILALPFIIYNYSHKKLNVVLGEYTLTQPYREFLTDALLAECNRSACFSLNTNNKAPLSDNVYSLDIKIIHNKTQSGIKETNTALLFPILFSGGDFEYFCTTAYSVLPTFSDLSIAVSLKKDVVTLWEKQYSTRQHFEHSSYCDFTDVSERCVYKMTQCLSLATEQIVTDISRDLNLILSSQ